MQTQRSEHKLLAVLAHPDDESFGIGGTLALYARRGAQVHLLCATRGEAGEVDAELMTDFKSIAERRESELRCAASILGLTSVSFLGFRDSGMPGSPDTAHPEALTRQPLEEVAARIVQIIRQFRPQVVVTFDPIGGYKHPDHIHIHQATRLAFDLAGERGIQTEYPPYRPQKLYYRLLPLTLLRTAVYVMPLFGMNPRRFGRNHDIDLWSVAAESDFPIHARINCRSVQNKKTAAIACHSSQVSSGLTTNGLMRGLNWLFGYREEYMRAHPQVNGRGRERDLFEGI
jgi:LmbE family N-acetylglucosaminyl deacetylase